MAVEDAVIGRYWPGNSPIHRMDPRAKLLLTLVLIIAAFVVSSQNFWGMLIYGAFILCFYAIAGIPIGSAFASIGPLFIIVILTAILNILFVEDGTVLWQWWIFCISTGGFVQALFIALRLTLLLLAVSLLTLTTSTLDITEGFERLLSPFKRFGMPAHELGMMMGITLRFLPQFVTEVQTTYNAQISRGASLTKGKLRTLTSLIVPLFASAFRHSDTLSSAMEARCYHGGEGRSRLHELKFTKLDGIATLVLVVMIVCLALANLLPY